MLSIIVAIDKNNAIGRKNQLLWHITADLKYFKSITAGHPVIMGRKTYESIGRPLPQRKNIVLTRSQIDFPAIKEGSNTSFLKVASINEILEMSKNSKEEFFVIGGGELYKQCFPFADKLYITHINAIAEEADTFFPFIEKDKWEVLTNSPIQQDPENNIEFRFTTYFTKKL